MKLDDIHTTTHSLTDTHFGQAFDCLLRVRESSNRSKSENQNSKSMLENRNSISTITHSFLGLESAINLIGEALFFDEESTKFILLDKRNYATNRLIQTWSKMPTLKKLDFLFSVSKSKKPPSKLLSELNELNTIRNWIVHGFSYKETFLLDEQAKNEYIIIDQELHIDWGKKFPNTKFNPLHNICEQDAHKALLICLKIAKYLAGAFQQPFSITQTHKKFKYNIIYEGMNLEELLNP